MSGAVIVFLVILATAVWLAFDPGDRRRLIVFAAGLAVAVYSPLCGLVLRFESKLSRLKFDGALYRIDRAIGVSALTIAAGLRHLHLAAFLSYAYCCLLPMMVFWCALQLHRQWRGPSILWAYATELVFGPLLYLLLPACGPIYAFPGFPFKTPAHFADVFLLNADPNAIPSIHVATAFVLLLFAHGKAWKSVAGLFLGLTILATISTGEHYVIDAMMGLPFACFVASAAHRRMRSASLYLALSVGWILLIRTQFPLLLEHPGFLRISLAITVALCIRFAVVGTSPSTYRATAEPALLPYPVKLKST